MPVRHEFEDDSVRMSEWSGNFGLQVIDQDIAALEGRSVKFPSREKARELANLKRNKSLMEALKRAWMRSVVEGAKSPMHVVLLQIDELSHAGLPLDCLNPEDFHYVHEKFPEFVPGPSGLERTASQG
jgi:hypothetical protein